MSFQIAWLPEARKLIGRRDRFIREDILKDFKERLEAFRAHRSGDAIELDHGIYAMSVLDNRYTVVWQFDSANPDLVSILGILATQMTSDDKVALKQKLNRVAFAESNGAVAKLIQ